MRFEFEETRRIISDGELLEDVRHVASEIGASSLTQRAYSARGQFSTAALKTRFGSWNKAVTAAGLVATSRANISDEQLFDNLRESWIKLGRQPRKREMMPPVSKYTHNPYIRRYGSWLQAMRVFVNTVEQSSEEGPAQAEQLQHSGRGSREPSLRLRFLVMKRDGFKCVICGCAPATDPSVKLHVDHVVPWSKGGATIADNLRTLCSRCNLGKGDLHDQQAS